MKKVFFVFVYLFSSFMPLQVWGKDEFPIKTLEEKIKVYHCEEYEFPTKEQCEGDLKSYIRPIWESMNKAYYQDFLEPIFTDNNYTAGEIIAEIYGINPKSENGNPSRTNTQSTQEKTSKIENFHYCLSTVCESLLSCEADKLGDKNPETYADERRWCESKLSKLQILAREKTKLSLQQRIHRRDRLAVVEEGMHRSVELFKGILASQWKIFQEFVNLEHKIDIYVLNPIQQ